MTDLAHALEDALAEDFDDLAAHSAYADHLQEQGDARGEFIQVQLALERPDVAGKQRRQLAAREKELLAANECRWLGELGQVLSPAWRRGWLCEARLLRWDLPRSRALARCHAARFLRRLAIERAGRCNYVPYPDDGVPVGSRHPTLYPLRDAAFLRCLRQLRLGEGVDFDKGRIIDRVEANAEGLCELLERADALEELEVFAEGEGVLGRLFRLTNLTRLRKLTLYHGTETHPLGLLADNPAFDALETLRIRPSPRAEGAPLPPAEVAALAQAAHLRSLRHLRLHSADLDDDAVRLFVRHGLLKRLKTLDLRFCRVTDAGAEALAACDDARRLGFLSLDYNRLTGRGQAALQGQSPHAQADPQTQAGLAPEDDEDWLEFGYE